MVTRVTGEPAYVLHRHDWSESSVIVEAFTRHHGRIALVARGAKKPSSNFRPVLLPMQALLLTWSGDAEIRALKGAEWGGGPVMPTSSRGGDALLAGYYASELILRLLARDDPHPRLFDGYAQLMHALAAPQAQPRRTAGLRAFELLLLREAGLLPALDVATLTLAPLEADAPYHLSPEGGLLASDSEDAGTSGLPGRCWLTLESALTDATPFPALLAAIEPWLPRERAQLRRQLRAWLDIHCGGQALKTRELLHGLQTLWAP
ncbi:MAG: DNA repair protein RecO [Burkholderiaceae bacterium]|jgi:DNA repair protein RecO (recombination protein O)|nr:DNA repair protein RecO [Burkholderiaceae bacterium]